MQFNSTTNGKPFGSIYSGATILTASTVSTAANKLVCHVKFSLTRRGVSMPEEGLFTFGTGPDIKIVRAWWAANE